MSLKINVYNSNRDEIPECPVCYEVLGKYGGPTTLPCGHNGCVSCLTQVQKQRPECPLCRKPFNKELALMPNTELRDLIKATIRQVYGGTVEGDWEAFPSLKTTNIQYIKEMQQSNDQMIDPSAPALDIHETIMGLEPVPWIPDSMAPNCGICLMPFKALVRSRHHCRMCGRVFCYKCSNKWLMLPPKFGYREPQRCCELCATVLQPAQNKLAQTLSCAVCQPIYDVTDSSSIRSWVNWPICFSMEKELYQSTNIIRNFMNANLTHPEKSIPGKLLQGACGFVVMSSVKLGLLGWRGTMGNGIVVAKRDDGSWSPPCAVGYYGLGLGLQFGQELIDTLLVMKTKSALEAFTGKVQLGLKGSVSCALGPLGRDASAYFTLGDGGHSACYSYSTSCKGAYVGFSVDGLYISVRDDVNHRFYGLPLTAKQLLFETTAAEIVAARVFYDALDVLISSTLTENLIENCEYPFIENDKSDFEKETWNVVEDDDDDDDDLY